VGAQIAAALRENLRSRGKTAMALSL